MSNASLGGITPHPPSITSPNDGATAWNAAVDGVQQSRGANRVQQRVNVNAEPAGENVASNDGSLPGLETGNAAPQSETSQANSDVPEHAELPPADSENVPPQGSARTNAPLSELEQLAANGDLEPGKTYPVSPSADQQKTSAKEATKSPIVRVEERSNPGALMLAQQQGRTITPGDGSSKDRPIAITPAQILQSVSVDGILNGVGADAFVIAIRGKVGAQNIPGWSKIPGIKELGKDAEVSYLAATLTPFDITDRSLSPLQSTLFLSVTVPGKKPLVITTKISDLNVEMGRPIKNEVLFGGKIIAFSNWRLGATLTDLDGVASANGGVLFRVNGLKRTVSQVQGLVKKVTRAAQAAEAATAAAAAPETAATSLAAGAATIAATELVRGTVSNSLNAADWYLGLAWRGSGSVGIHERSVTLKAQKGPLTGKWVVFKLADIPGAIFESKTPDFETPNREYLNTEPLLKNLKPEIKEGLATGLVKHEAKPLLQQLTSYLNISFDELVDWLNKCDAHWVAARMDQMQPGPDGHYSLTPSLANDALLRKLAPVAKYGFDLPENIDRYILPQLAIKSIPDLIKVMNWSTQPKMPNKHRD